MAEIRELPRHDFCLLTHKVKFFLWNQHGRQMHGRQVEDPDVWLAEFLATSRVDKGGRSMALRAFTRVFNKFFKEEEGIEGTLTFKDRRLITWFLKVELKGWVRPGGGPFHVKGT
jgi:hypothetical protein